MFLVLLYVTLPSAQMLENSPCHNVSSSERLFLAWMQFVTIAFLLFCAINENDYLISNCNVIKEYSTVMPYTQLGLGHII